MLHTRSLDDKIVGVDEKEAARPFEGESAICTNGHHPAYFKPKT